MPVFRKLGLIGSAVIGLCIPKTALAKMSVASDTEEASPDRFEVGHLREKGLELKMVQIFFRHGARTPLHALPNPNNLPELEVVWDKDKLFADADRFLANYIVKSLDGGKQPVMELDNIYRRTVFKGGSLAGQLTTIGKGQMYELGKLYKKHYIDDLKFLEPTYTTEHIYVRSTNILRTIESASCVLAAMFGETLKKSGPVTIYTDAPKTEILYPNARYCSKLKIFSKTFWQNTDAVPGTGRFRMKLQEILGLPQSMHLDLVSLRDNLAAMKAHELYIPRLLEPLIDLIERRATSIIKYYVSKSGPEEKEALFLSCGLAIQMMRKNIQQSVNGERFQKFHIYSCHDTTLVSMLCALKAFDNCWPPYAADLIFELYEDKEGNSFVRTLYIGKEQRIMNSRESILPLEKFLELTSEVAISREKLNEICGGRGEMLPSCEMY